MWLLTFGSVLLNTMNDIANISSNHVSIPRTEEKIQILEQEMMQMPQVECSVEHIFGPNVYIRQVTIPADTFSIGHYQNTEHLNIMLKGRVTMVNEDGSHTELIAPVTFVSKPGRKVGYIHETMVWQNVYATNETSVEKLEEKYITKSITWQEQQKAQQMLLSYDMSEDVADYYKTLEEYGFDHETVLQQVLNEEDQIQMPFGSWKFTVAPSRIEGYGVFATSNLEKDTVVGPARIEGKRTPLGRYTNHSKTPNAKMVLKENGDIDLVMLNPVSGCMGGQLGSEITVDYRQVLNLSLNG